MPANEVGAISGASNSEADNRRRGRRPLRALIVLATLIAAPGSALGAGAHAFTLRLQGTRASDCTTQTTCPIASARVSAVTGPTVALATRPPMGWNSWNHFHCGVDEQTIKNAANALVATGMRESGYTYVNIDDCWPAHTRDARGDLQPNPTRFPHGITYLATYVHRLGLKLGIYEDAGVTTCAGYPGSYGHEVQDALQFARWGVDYLKYDFCHHTSMNLAPDIDRITVTDREGFTATVEAGSPGARFSGGAALRPCATCPGGATASGIGNGTGSVQFIIPAVPAAGQYGLTVSFSSSDPLRLGWISVNGGTPIRLSFPGGSGANAAGSVTAPITLAAGPNTVRIFNPLTAADNARMLYQRMRDALDGAGRPIVLSVCDPYRVTEPWRWGGQVGKLWRTTADIHDRWTSIMNILDQQVGLDRWAAPGHWNDPDMLEVGNGGMSEVEDRTHFALWSMLAAPLLAGNDLTRISPATRATLTNGEIIAIDQDALGVEARRVMRWNNQEVWLRPLANGDRAVLLLNRGSRPAAFHLTRHDLGLDPTRTYVFRDLWVHTDLARRSSLFVTVRSHGGAIFRVRAVS